MATPVNAVKASDPWEMALIHRVIRRGFEQARAHVLAAGAESRAAAVAAYVDFQLDGLYAHHSSEDELLWPLLLERAELSAGLIHRMEQQHAAVHEAVDSARDAVTAWRTTPTAAGADSLSTALETVSARLAEHLGEEERDVVPLIATHITQAEWDHLGKVAFSKFKSNQRFTAMGELLATARPEEAARMLAGLPAPVRVIWRLFGQRNYQRSMKSVEG
ncbi:hemerythrin HHE cation binding domain-containing protein [Kribbella sp. VKM Ac-2569]|uniref:hemerythrin domain-containing protein n=1 Tax=Kribbella sp. VKM Ac-2569 TaxID=2512220 RepID=UPI00102AC25A|nr:hemerythrin domain-containing protein [Kribbella sp. VKM Ac-2569]RZT27147.1 hemerythrin HHE cation binding domain-containing protein [Kribbella sp. VKM Ac-2569]